ncbi:ataxin-7 isoform X3 [Callorhinchus milii]|uniref:ataxin-7 isoform X3 n=1 Tax=Callorhinchus milii TaxID=7868 RepID=UPI001C3FA9E6|nr:ataxin-7 isoform X3 [Callorhinchus milii]
MAETAEADVRVPRRAARQQEGSAMATVERRLPSPEALVGQPWTHWVDAAKHQGADGTELEETFKECGKNREVMRLSREDMPIFGHCPAHDDFYLVMCNHCNQVVKPQAFQAHYERRHSSSSKPPLTPPSTSSYSFPSTVLKNKSGSDCGSSRSSSGNSASSNSKIQKPPKDKLHISASGMNRPLHPIHHGKMHHDKNMTSVVKAEKMHPNVKIDGTSLKMPPIPSSTTVNPSSKPDANCPIIPKAPSLGQIPNGKSLLLSPSSSEKKLEDTKSSKKSSSHKRLSEREFDPNRHCGVVDLETKKPCTRSLTCKTHSLSQRRAVPGRRKLFDLLLAEHKNKPREKESYRNSEHHQQAPPLRELHPSPSKSSQELHQNSHGNLTSDVKQQVPVKTKPHNSSLPRLTNSSQSGSNTTTDCTPVHEVSHPSLLASEPVSRLSSDEGECDEKEESTEKLDCCYSGHHPRPAAFCTFGNRQIGRGCFVFDRRWDHFRCALSSMVEKHLNSQMWKKIPPAVDSPVSAQSNPQSAGMHSSPVPHYSVNATGFISPTSMSSSSSSTLMTSPVLVSSPFTSSVESKSVLSYGTTLNAHPAALGVMDPAYCMQSRHVSSPSAMPSGLPSVPSPVFNKPQKMKPGKSFKPKDPSLTSSNCNSNSNSSSSGKKRKNSSALPLHSSSAHSTESLKKNCVMNFGNLGTSYHSSVSSSSYSSAYNVGHNCTNKMNSLGLKHDQSGRGLHVGTPAESIKRMSVVMNSSDSTLSLGPFVHHSNDQTVNSHGGFSHPHTPLEKPEGKKRKSTPGSSTINSGSKPNKVAKSPMVNNVHTKHASMIPGTPGLSSNSLLHQPKGRP